MLIAFVLLGRNLEQRAKIKATSDMTSLLSIIPSKARLVINGDEEESISTVEVPSNSLSVGDHIVVLPGVSLLLFKQHCIDLLKHQNKLYKKEGKYIKLLHEADEILILFRK